MYQEEMKNSFIEDYKRSRVVAVTSLYGLFRKVEPFENKLHKDCCEFTKEEILNMYAEFKAKSPFTVMNYTTILDAYCKWNIYYHNPSSSNEYTYITIDDIKPLIPENPNKTLSRNDIIEIEDCLLNWTDKAIVECLFEGLAGNSMNDITCIEIEMIDHERKQLHLPDNRIFNLTDRLYELLIEACNETEYICYGETLRVKKMTGKGKLYKKRDNAHAKDSDDVRFRWIYRRVQNFRKHLGITGLTMKNIATSGMCYYLKKGMDATGLDLKSFLMTSEGNKLMDKYGYTSTFRVDNVTLYYRDLV